MNPISEERFYELALKLVLNQCTPGEKAELQAALDKDPRLDSALNTFRAEYTSAKELVSLLAATEATEGKPSENARKQFRKRVDRHFGVVDGELFEPTKPGKEPKATMPNSSDRSSVQPQEDSILLRFFAGFAVFEIVCLAVTFQFSQYRESHLLWPSRWSSIHTNWGKFTALGVIGAIISLGLAWFIANRKKKP